MGFQPITFDFWPRMFVGLLHAYSWPMGPLLYCVCKPFGLQCMWIFHQWPKHLIQDVGKFFFQMAKIQQAQGVCGNFPLMAQESHTLQPPTHKIIMHKLHHDKNKFNLDSKKTNPPDRYAFKVIISHGLHFIWPSIFVSKFVFCFSIS